MRVQAGNLDAAVAACAVAPGRATVHPAGPGSRGTNSHRREQRRRDRVDEGHRRGLDSRRRREHGEQGSSPRQRRGRDGPAALPEALRGAHGAYLVTNFWQQIAPPQPDPAAALFAGHRSQSARLDRLLEELDASCTRASGPLWSAVKDRDQVPERAVFLDEVAADIAAIVTGALDAGRGMRPVRTVAAVLDFTVWRALSGSGIGRQETTRRLPPWSMP